MKNYCASHLLRCAQLANEAYRSPYYRVLSRGSLRGSAAGGARLRERSPWRRPGSGSKRAGLLRIMRAPSRSDPRYRGAPPPALRRALHMGLLVTFFLRPSDLLRTSFRAQAA
jgi:hypothetical protein